MRIISAQIFDLPGFTAPYHDLPDLITMHHDLSAKVQSSITRPHYAP
jgi:hypothetical protein